MNVSSDNISDPVANVTDHRANYDNGGSADVILFIFASCALGALVRQIIRSIKIALPYTVVLLLLGMLFGLVSKKVPVLQRYVAIVDTNPHVILFVFLPVLIFESAFAMEVHTFKKCFFQVLLLAVPGLALMALLTCILALYLFTYGWDWNIGMMFGSILSATDPIAVVAILRDIGASKKLAMVTEGESLLNDGAAIVLFKVFLNLATSTTPSNGGQIVLSFLQVALGGPAFGLLMAKLTLFWLSRIFNDALAEITITLASTYITFYVGEEFLGVSGVLSVVVLGVVMSSKRTSISPEVETFLHRFWETLAYLANTLIFILVGVIISEKVIYKIHGTDWFFMFALYFGLNVIRGLVIGLMCPLLQHIGYGMTWQDGLVLTWSGLRGAIGLTLALLVWEDPRLNQDTVRHKVLIHVAGVVFLTLLINATTIHPLLRLLGMSDVSAAKRMAMASALRFIQDLRQKTLNMLKTDRFLADADWEMVEKACEIEDPYKTTREEADLDESLLEIRPNSVCPECECSLPSQPTQKELRDMTNEAILRMLKAEKLSYWRQFEQGMLSREAVQKLQECAECAADGKGMFIDVDEVKKSWEVPSLLIRVKRKLKEVIRKRPVNIRGDVPHTQVLHKITTHWVFNVVIYVLIGFDTISSTLAIVAEYVLLFADYKIILQLFNVFLVLVYITEVILKLIPQGRSFLSIIWQVLSLFIIGHGIIDAVLQFSLASLDTGHNKPVRNTLVVFIILRAVRLLRLVEPLLPLLLMMVKTRISLHLSYGYDLGRGFVAGEDEVRKLIDHMVDSKDIAKQLKGHVDDCRLEVIRCLGHLQKQHPDIALSAKTRQAIRSVLNNLRDGIHELWEDGILQEAEGEKLKKMVEIKMKRLLNAPPTIPLPEPEKMLNNVTWMHNDEKLIDYMKSRAKLVSYDYGDIILKQGDPTSGIFIIVSGMVRLETSIKQKATSSHKIHPVSETKIIDFMTTGNIIGEMGLLTQRQRVATVRCDTAVQLLFISSEDMEQGIIEFADSEPSLEYRLWKVCAIRLATGVLMDQPGYQGLTKEKIKLRLENAYLTDIRDGITFSIDSSMADVLLINGFAQNAYTREQFLGPCYIPWTVLKLNLQPEKGPSPIVLVVPSELGQVAPVAERRLSAHDIRSEHGAYLSSLSRLCLRHASVQRNIMEMDKKGPLGHRHSVTQFLSRRLSRDSSKGDNRVNVLANGYSQGETPCRSMLGKRMSTPACIETHQRKALLNISSTSMPLPDSSQDYLSEDDTISLPGSAGSITNEDTSTPNIGRRRSSSGVIITDILHGGHHLPLGPRRSSDIDPNDTSGFGQHRSSDILHDHRLSPLPTTMEENESDVSDTCSVERPVDTEERPQRALGGGSGSHFEQCDASVSTDVSDDAFEEVEDDIPRMQNGPVMDNGSLKRNGPVRKNGIVKQNGSVKKVDVAVGYGVGSSQLMELDGEGSCQLLGPAQSSTGVEIIVHQLDLPHTEETNL
ncbi:sperm-specific sodium:proton exchanger-like [Haliotis cracherodii]|uniref:sperm-specific sodium:proton exchanger-like n=1 Tax=Haliotis cracherodii TaxID=6455 RepID=UPI0039EA8538